MEEPPFATDELDMGSCDNSQTDYSLKEVVLSENLKLQLCKLELENEQLRTELATLSDQLEQISSSTDRNSRDKAIKFSSQAIRSATYGKGDEPVEGVDLTDLPEETGNLKATLHDRQFTAQIHRVVENCSKSSDEFANTLVYIQQLERERDELLTGLEQIQLRCAELENTNQRLKNDIEQLSGLRHQYYDVQDQNKTLELANAELRAGIERLSRTATTLSPLCIETPAQPNNVLMPTSAIDTYMYSDRTTSPNDLTIHTPNHDSLHSPTSFVTAEGRSSFATPTDIASPHDLFDINETRTPGNLQPNELISEDAAICEQESDSGGTDSITSYTTVRRMEASSSAVELNLASDQVDPEVLSESSTESELDTEILFRSKRTIRKAQDQDKDNGATITRLICLDTENQSEHNHGDESVDEGEDESEEDEHLSNYSTPQPRVSYSKTTRHQRTTGVNIPRSSTRRRRSCHSMDSSGQSKQRNGAEDVIGEETQSSTKKANPRGRAFSKAGDQIQAKSNPTDKQPQTLDQGNLPQQEEQPSSIRPPNRGTEGSLKEDIQASYTRYGLKTCLVFDYNDSDFSRNTIIFRTNWKYRAKLTEDTWKKLQGQSQEILQSFPASTNARQVQIEKDLIVKLCRGTYLKSSERSLTDIAMEIYRGLKCKRDELNYAAFEFYSLLIIMKYAKKEEFNATIENLSDYKSDVMDVYNSIHSVISLLEESWKDLHALVVIYLRRGPIKRLTTYFAPTTRPAAIELLANSLNDPEKMKPARELIRSLFTESVDAHERSRVAISPLIRLQKRVQGIVESRIVMEALGYTSDYSDQMESLRTRTSFPTPTATPRVFRFSKPIARHEESTSSPSATPCNSGLSSAIKRKAIAEIDETRGIKKRHIANMHEPCGIKRKATADVEEPYSVKKQRIDNAPCTDDAQHTNDTERMDDAQRTEL